MSNDELRNELARLRGHLASSMTILRELAQELEEDFDDDITSLAEHVLAAQNEAQHLEDELEE